MSDNIPFDVQKEIIKKFPVKSLVQFRSVSKPWKAFIDSSKFINTYHTRQQRHHLLVSFFENYETKYVLVLDDKTFPENKFTPTIPMSIKQLELPKIVGSSLGLVCLYSSSTAVIWNPSIGKSVSIVVPSKSCEAFDSFGFGVCPHTCDPMLVRVMCDPYFKRRDPIVEVFKLSTGAWTTPSTKPPRRSLDFRDCDVNIDGVIYWHVKEMIRFGNGFRGQHVIVAFDLTSLKFEEIDLPDHLKLHSEYKLSISKRRESLVVLEYFSGANYVVWMMENGAPRTFTKIFNIKIGGLRGFRNSGEPVIERSDGVGVYEPNTKHIDYMGISKDSHSSFTVIPYMETLLLLDH